MCWIDIIERFKQLPIAEQEAITRALKERYATRVVPVEVVDGEYHQVTYIDLTPCEHGVFGDRYCYVCAHPERC